MISAKIINIQGDVANITLLAAIGCNGKYVELNITYPIKNGVHELAEIKYMSGETPSMYIFPEMEKFLINILNRIKRD